MYKNCDITPRRLFLNAWYSSTVQSCQLFLEFSICCCFIIAFLKIIDVFEEKQFTKECEDYGINCKNHFLCIYLNEERMHKTCGITPRRLFLNVWLYSPKLPIFLRILETLIFCRFSPYILRTHILVHKSKKVDDYRVVAI